MSAWTVADIDQIGDWYIVSRGFGFYRADTGGNQFVPVIYGAFRDRAEAESLLAAIKDGEAKAAAEMEAAWNAASLARAAVRGEA